MSLTHRRHQHLHLLPGSSFGASSPSTTAVRESVSSKNPFTDKISALFINSGGFSTSLWDTQKLLPQKTAAGCCWDKESCIFQANKCHKHHQPAQQTSPELPTPLHQTSEKQLQTWERARRLVGNHNREKTNSECPKRPEEDSQLKTGVK